jgi:hypothetical protein
MVAPAIIPATTKAATIVNFVLLFIKVQNIMCRILLLSHALFSEYVCKTDSDISDLAHQAKISYFKYANNALN